MKLMPDIETCCLVALRCINPPFKSPFQNKITEFTTGQSVTYRGSEDFHFTKRKMIRRKPTAITLTTEDVAMYEDARAREALQHEEDALQEQQNVTPQQKGSQNRDPNDELRPLPGDRARGGQIKTREERLGLAGGSSRN